MKKIVFIISSFIFLGLGIYLFVQFFLFGNKKNENNRSGESVLVDTKEIDGDERMIENVLSGKIKSPQINSLGNKILYFNQNNFLSTSLDGKTKTSLGSYPYNDIKSIFWSSQGDYAIINDSDKYYVFNIKDSESELFKGGADNLVWGNNGNQLIYKFYDQTVNKRSLNISDISGDNWQEITEIPFRYAEIKVNPKSEKVALFSKPTFKEKTEIFIVDLTTKEKKEINKKYKGADYRWSPDGKKLLFSYTKESGGSNLAILYPDGEDIIELNFPGLVDKCVWSDDSIILYCAGLNFDNPVFSLPDDWKDSKISSTDTFWKIDTAKGEQARLIKLEEINEDIDAEHLFLDGNEKFLFFIDKKTENLFRIKLDN